MANDPTDTTKYPLGTNDLYVAARNAGDFDKGINAGNTTFVNRFGKVLPTFEKAISDAKANYGGLNNRGDWVTLRAYAVNDLWQSTVDDTWYLVLTAYTSGVDEAADIASGNVEVFQGIARQDAVIKIASVFDVDAFSRLEEGDAVELIGYHPNTTVGGGSGVVKSARHNGGTAISLTRERPTDWTDQAQLTAWFADSGSDELCYFRQDSESIKMEWFGARKNSTGLTGVGDDDSIPAQASLNIGKKTTVDKGILRLTQTISPVVGGQILQGAGVQQTTFFVDHDGVGVWVNQSNNNLLKDFSVTGQITHSITSHGIQNGLPTGGWGSRTTLDNVFVSMCGGDGIRISDGNLGTLNDIVSINNNKNGIHFTDEAGDNHSWGSSGKIDVRSNGEHGIYIPEGVGAFSPDSSKSHMFPVVTAQQNGLYGVYIGTRSNVMNIYSEANGSGSVYIANDSGAIGNFVNMVEGNAPTFENANADVSTTANFVTNNNFDARYARSFIQALFEDQITMERIGRNGKWQLRVDDTNDRELVLQGFGSGGSDYALNLQGGSANGDSTATFTLNTSRIKSEWHSTPETFADGDTTPVIANSNSFICANTSPTTITLFDGRAAGKEFNVIFDGNTTIQNNSNIYLLGGATETPANNHMKRFICNPKNTSPFFLEISKVNF